MEIIHAFAVAPSPEFVKERNGCLFKCLLVTAMFASIPLIFQDLRNLVVGAVMVSACLAITAWAMVYGSREAKRRGPRLEFEKGKVTSFQAKEPLASLEIGQIQGLEVVPGRGLVAQMKDGESVWLDVGFEPADGPAALQALEAYRRYAVDSGPRPRPAVPVPISRERFNQLSLRFHFAFAFFAGLPMCYQMAGRWRSGQAEWDHYLTLGIWAWMLLMFPFFEAYLARLRASAKQPSE